MKRLIMAALGFAISLSIGFGASGDIIKPIDEDESLYTKGSKDTYILRDEADFRKWITWGVYWEPFNALGKGEYTDTEILELANTRDPETIQEAIHTAYDAYQYFYLSNFRYSSDMTHNVELDGESWEIHLSGRYALYANRGDCAAFSSLFSFLLEDDYDEIGYLTILPIEGEGHVINYLIEDGKYYFIDMTAMFAAVIEQEGIYEENNYHGNLISASSFDRFIDYYKKSVDPAPALYATVKELDFPPICVTRDDEGYLLKVAKDQSFTVVRNDDPDNIQVERVLTEKIAEGDIYFDNELNDRYSKELPIMIPELKMGDYGLTGVREYVVYYLVPRGHCQLLEMKRIYRDHWGDVLGEECYQGEELQKMLPNTNRFPGMENELVWSDEIRNRQIASVEISITAQDDRGRIMTERVDLDLTQFEKGRSESSLDEGEFDYEGLREKADFRIPIAQGIDWVPLNALGKPNSPSTAFHRSKKAEHMKEEIDSLYEAVVAIKELNLRSPDYSWVNVNRGNYWKFYAPGHYLVGREELYAENLAALVNYWLEDDYDETGIVFYAWSDGYTYATNFFREDGQLYYVDLVGYLNMYNYYSPETGSLEDYYDNDYGVGNLYRADNEKSYFDFIFSEGAMPAPIMVQYSYPEVLPTRFRVFLGDLELVMPLNCEGTLKAEYIYDEPGDGFTFAEDFNPTSYPGGYAKYFDYDKRKKRTYKSQAWQ